MPQRKARSGLPVGSHTFFKRGRNLGTLHSDDIPDPLTVGVITATSLTVTGTLTTTTIANAGSITTGSATVTTTLTAPNFTSVQDGDTSHGGHFNPNLDSTYALGEATTPLRWSNVHTDQVTFSDATSLTTAPSASNPLETIWTAGATITTGQIVYVSGVDTVSPVTATTTGKAIGWATEDIASSSTGTILMYGPIAVVSTGGAVTAGDFVTSGITAGKVYSAGTTRLTVLAGTTTQDLTSVQTGVPAAHDHTLNAHLHDIGHAHGFSSSATGSNHQHAAGTYATPTITTHSHTADGTLAAAATTTAAQDVSSTTHTHQLDAFISSPHAHNNLTVNTSGTTGVAKQTHIHDITGDTGLGGDTGGGAIVGSSANDGGHSHTSSSVTNMTGNSAGPSTTNTGGFASGTSTFTLSLSTHVHAVSGLTATPPEILGIAKGDALVSGTNNLTIVMIRL